MFCGSIFFGVLSAFDATDRDEKEGDAKISVKKLEFAAWGSMITVDSEMIIETDP